VQYISRPQASKKYQPTNPSRRCSGRAAIELLEIEKGGVVFRQINGTRRLCKQEIEASTTFVCFLLLKTVREDMTHVVQISKGEELSEKYEANDE